MFDSLQLGNSTTPWDFLLGEVSGMKWERVHIIKAV